MEITVYRQTVNEILNTETKIKCPLDISIIPNTMGINLRSVTSVEWAQQEDGQLLLLTIHFRPDNLTNKIGEKNV